MQAREITYHTGLKFLRAIFTADSRCGWGSMNRSGLTFPLACGMLGVGRDMHRYALPKKGSKDKETALATSDVYKGQVCF